MSRSPQSNSRPDAGFTLVEALVVLAILAVALPSLGGLVAIAAKGTRSASQRVAMTVTAETLLNELPARAALSPGRQSGELSGYRWLLDVTPIPTEDAGRWLPLQIALQLQAPGGARVRLSTVRVVSRAQP